MNIKINSRYLYLFRIALVVMSVVTFIGVAGAQEKTGTTQQSIIVKNVRFWTANSNIVPVCWETPGYNAEKAIVRSAVSNTWERYSYLSFTGWGACPTGGIGGSSSEKHMRIRIKPQGNENAGAGGSASGYGMDTLSSADDNRPGVTMFFNPDGSADRGRIEYTAVHEFGHVLGFVHEQDSPGNVDAHGVAYCKSPGNEANATALTEYDPDSIMNYCNKDGNMKGNLTAKDIQGLQSIYGARSLRTAWDEGITGVLLVGKFRTRQQLNAMAFEDRRNTLIVELSNRTKDTVAFYQSLNDADLAGTGALLVYLREVRSRTDQQIKTMSADDMRNIVIIEVNARIGRGIRELQAMSNLEVVKSVTTAWDEGITGVLQMGKFRTRQQLNAMPSEDRRNTLIVELSNRTKDTVGYYQSLNDADLAGTGALLVHLRVTGSRTDQQIKTMSADDMRNLVIVEAKVLTGREIRELQAMSNLEVVKSVTTNPNLLP